MPLDPELRARLEPFADADWHELLAAPDRFAAYMAAFSATQGYEPPIVATRDAVVEGPIGSFGVRVYEPPLIGSRPVLVWAHSGGFIGGNLEIPEADIVSREMCARASALVSVDYHLAGAGGLYPTLHREVVAATRWAMEHAPSAAQQ
jgi:acetyl esterase/lipase